MNALDYLLKANLYGLLFVSCYWLLLRRHTFLNLNRAYLLLSAVLSLILPLVSLPAQTVETLPGMDWPVPVGVIALPVASIAAAPIDIPQAQAGPDWETIGLLIYELVALTLLLRLFVRIGRLLWMIRQSPRQACDTYVLVEPKDPSIPTFSFFRYMILNPADSHNSLIIDHELVHIRQQHSIDVIGISLLRSVFWACPALWLIDRMLRQVHEFLADKPTNQPSDYARFLVEYTFGIRPDTLTNGFFNPSLLKQRILMLHQKATTRWALGKYALVLPLAFGLLSMTTARDEITAAVSQATDDMITVSGVVTDANRRPLSGAHVIIKGTTTGTETTAEGRYTLKNVSKNASLFVSFVGFKSVSYEITHATKLNITLQPILSELPTMGATDAYRAVKPNPAMPVRTPPSSHTINGQVFTAVEEAAVFPTGIPGLMQYVAHTLRYPAKARLAGVQGNVLVQFVVLPTGAIGLAKIKKGIGSGCDEEALRVVKQMPHWLPGKQNGKAVAMEYVLPIQFALEKREDKRTGQISPTNQTGSEPNMSVSSDNNRNGRFAVQTNFSQKPIVHPDSNLVSQPDSGSKPRLKFRAFPSQKPDQTSQTRYSLPIEKRFTMKPFSQTLPGGKPELFLLNGVKQIDRIEDINKNDIESIEVYKGEDIITKYKILYGEKASKGVVIIHLKSANVL